MLTQTNFKAVIAALFPNYTIYEDIGEYVEASRVAGTNTVTIPICGLFRMSPYNYVASNGLRVANATATVEFVPTPLQKQGVVDTINSVAAVNSNVATIMTETIGTAPNATSYSYTVVASYSSAYVGTEQSAPSNMGEIVPVQMLISWFIFENGVNGNDITLKIDGKPIFYTEINTARTRTVDAVPKQTGKAEAKILNTNASITFNAPLLTTDGSAILQSAIFNAATNDAHCVEVKINNTYYRYIMTFGNCVNTSAPGQNAGVQIVLHETSPDEVETWGGTWGVYPVTGSTAYLNITATTIIFWGDGTTSTAATYTSHNYTDGLTQHTVVTYGSTPLVYRSLRVGDILYGKKLKYIGDDIESNIGVTTFITCSDGSYFGLDADSIFREFDWEGSPTTISSDSYLFEDTEWTSILRTVSVINATYAGMFQVLISEMGL